MKKFEEALTNFGYPHDWDNLYRTWDVISPDLGKLARDNVINKDNDDRFKKTANHYRHGGHQKPALPDDPMSPWRGGPLRQSVSVSMANFQRAATTGV